MPIVSDIKYETIVNQVKNWLKSNCVNITNYASIEAQFKPSYTQNMNKWTHGSTIHTSKVTITKSVPSASSSNVDNDMKAFCNTYKISDKLQKYVSEDEFYEFIQNMISFMCTHCRVACSQLVQNKEYIVYIPSVTDYSEVFDITSDEQQNIINATDVLSLMTTMFTVVHRSLRCHNCTYKWELIQSKK